MTEQETGPRATGFEILLMAAFLLGLTSALWAGFFYAPAGDDSTVYGRLAHNLTAGHGLSLSPGPPYAPSALRSPGYPLFLAFLHVTVGDSWLALLLCQSLLIGAMAMMVTATAWKLFGRRVAFVCFLLVAPNPYLGRWAGAQLTEALYLTVIVGCVLALASGASTRRSGPLVAAGLLWGAGVLLRPLTVVMLPLFAIAVWIYPSPRPRLGHLAAFVLAGAGALAPWVVRNYIQFHRFIPLQVHAAGANFWLTTLPREDQPTVSWVGIERRWSYEKYPELRAADNAGDDTNRRAEAERGLAAAALRRVRERPLDYLLSRLTTYPRLWIHSGRLWYGTLSFERALAERRWWALVVKTSCFLAFSFLPLSLAFLGFWVLRRSWRLTFPLMVVPLAIGLAHIPLWIEDRYGLPAVPFFLVLASAGLVHVLGPRSPTTVEPLPKNARISVVIPSRNEGALVVETAEATREALAGWVDEVLVVDGRSTDGSPDELRRRGFRVIADAGGGKGAGIRAGIQAATGDVVVLMDADGSHDPRQIRTLVQPVLDGHADMVIGCRMRGGSDEFAGSWALFLRLWGNNVLTLIINARFQESLTDSQNGFRAARAAMLRDLALRESKHTIELEMVMKSLRAGHRIVQVPSHEYCRRSGQSSLSIVHQTPHFCLCLLRNIW